MATSIDIRRVEAIIDYQYGNTSLIEQALRAPVKIQDKETERVLHRDDGNRRLALLGHKVLDLVLADLWYQAGSDRENIQDIMTKLAENKFLASIAKRRGLDTCISCCERQGDDSVSPKTLKLTVTAIIAAVWLDSDRSLEVVVQVIKRLRILTIPEH